MWASLILHLIWCFVTICFFICLFIVVLFFISFSTLSICLCIAFIVRSIISGSIAGVTDWSFPSFIIIISWGRGIYVVFFFFDDVFIWIICHFFNFTNKYSKFSQSPALTFFIVKNT